MRFEPHTCCLPNHAPGCQFLHEWREDIVAGAKAHRSGPMVEFRKGAEKCRLDEIVIGNTSEQ